jgi:hypothetical protein
MRPRHGRAATSKILVAPWSRASPARCGVPQAPAVRTNAHIHSRSSVRQRPGDNSSAAAMQRLCRVRNTNFCRMTGVQKNRGCVENASGLPRRPRGGTSHVCTSYVCMYVLLTRKACVGPSQICASTPLDLRLGFARRTPSICALFARANSEQQQKSPTKSAEILTAEQFFRPKWLMYSPFVLHLRHFRPLFHFT